MSVSVLDESRNEAEPVSAAVLERLTGGVPNCSPGVVRVLRDIAVLPDQDLTGDLATASQLSDDVTALARAVTVLHGELARRTHAATLYDVLPSSAQSVLTGAKVPAGAAAGIRRAGVFAACFPQIGELLATGRVSTDVVAAIARCTAGLTHGEIGQIVAAILPTLPDLTKAQAEQAVSMAVDLLHPQDAEAKEQSDWDARGLSHTSCNGIWQFALTLPELEGATFWATIQALAQSLRTADQGQADRPTAAQRRADAVMLLVAKAHAAGQIPSNKGTPAAAVVTIGLTEAERVAAGQGRQPSQDLCNAAAAADGAPAAHVQGSDTTLGDAAARFVLCFAHITGILVDPHTPTGDPSDPDNPNTRASALATALGLSHLLPLAEGRAKRCFTEPQRRAMAVRDHGCVYPDCPIPPGECEGHLPHRLSGG